MLADAALAPLDHLRQAVMRAVLRTPGLRRWLLDRDARVGAHAFLGAATAVLMTVFVPAFLFVVGPLLLGVAHVASDVRYLLLRRSVPRGVAAMAALFCGSLFAVRCAELLGFRGVVSSLHEVMLIELWTGASVIAAGLASGRRGRAALGLGVVLGVGALAQAHPDLFRLVFAHLHNLVGLGLWLLLFRRRIRPVLPALALLAAGSALVLGGATLGLTHRVGGLSFAGQNLMDVSDWVAPHLPARLALGAVLSYVLLQAVHYSVWLGWVPQEDTLAEGTTSFRMSLRSLRADMGWLLWPVALAAGAVPLLALVFGAALTRDTYLSLASFHGYLELAMLAYFLVAPASFERRHTTVRPAEPATEG